MRIPLLAALLLTLTLPLSAEEPAPKALKVVWTIDKDLAAPESAYVEPGTDTVYLSNIDGEGATKDGNGYISKLTTAGKMLEPKWLAGLNAPKGLRSHRGTLWVSDIDELLGISIKEAKITERHKVEGAVFLNDVAAGPDGTIYVADLPASKIYQLKAGKVSLLAEGEQLESPNGLLVDGNRLLICGWGYAPDFMPKTLGRLLALDLKTKKVTPITEKPTGNLDGLEVDGRGGYTATDWKAGKLLHIAKDGKTTLLGQYETTTADHAYLPKESLLILPHMMQNKLVAYEFKPEK